MSSPSERKSPVRPQASRWLFAAAVFVVSFAVAGVAADWLVARDGTYGYLKMFNEVLLLIQNSYVEETEMPGLMRGAYDGLLGSLDPDSEYLTKDQYVRLTREPEETDGDVGIDLSRRGGYLYVVSVVPDSPADRAGLTSGMRLRRIEGVSTREMTLTEGTLALRGTVGSSVEVQQFPPREGGEDTLALVRERVQTPTPETVDHADALIVRIPSLQPGATDAVRQALEKADDPEQPLLLDLRGSSAGSYDEATRLVALFVPNATIGRIEGREADQRELRTGGSAPGAERAVGLLVDRGTAGPSELVVAALRTRAWASVIGSKTFGRAKLQQFLPLNDGGYLRLSIARCVGPEGETWDDEGFDPDHTLAAEEEEILDKAVEILRNPPEKEPAA